MFPRHGAYHNYDHHYRGRISSTEDEFHPGDKWYGVADAGFFTGPLTSEAMDDMTVVQSRERREVLGAIALPLAIAATAMGAFNLAQIEALKSKLFELNENTGRLFEVIQDFSKNMQAIEDSFNELLRSTMIKYLILDPVLFDARLTRLENQIRHRLQRVGHAVQAALHHCFAMDYLHPKEYTLWQAPEMG